MTTLKITAEEFLREKLESQIGSFGDGVTDFHTREIQHLLLCLNNKDSIIQEKEAQISNLLNKVSFDAERKFNELLESCMIINNLSAEERLRCIRKKYKEIWEQIP